MVAKRQVKPSPPLGSLLPANLPVSAAGAVVPILFQQSQQSSLWHGGVLFRFALYFILLCCVHMHGIASCSIVLHRSTFLRIQRFRSPLYISYLHRTSRISRFGGMSRQGRRQASQEIAGCGKAAPVIVFAFGAPGTPEPGYRSISVLIIFQDDFRAHHVVHNQVP